MVTIPLDIPVTVPVTDMVAIVGSLVPHEPPAVVLLNTVDEPTQTVEAPEIAIGSGLTVIVQVVVQPPIGSVYVIVVVPARNPVTIPVVEPMSALAGALLDHVPPIAGSVR